MELQGYNIVFPETLEERNSVSRLLNHAQYDGGGFRWADLISPFRGERSFWQFSYSHSWLHQNVRFCAMGCIVICIDMYFKICNRNQQLADIVRNARRCRRLTLSVKSEQRLKFSLRSTVLGVVFQFAHSSSIQRGFDLERFSCT